MKSAFVVHHIVSATPSKISEVLERQLAIAPSLTEDLLYQGSIWYNHVRVRENIVLEKGAYLRVHAEPRRFPSEKVNWRKTVLYEDDEFLVIQKPSGIPVHATVDNFVENVIYSLQKELECEIYVTQRLDTATEGILLLAKTKWFQSQFNKLLRERDVRKTYLARIEKEIPTGELVHYMQQTLQAPKVVSRTPHEGWQECRLIIESVNTYNVDFDLEIELLTGRTHQIRAQLADLGAPILGDKMYGSQRENPWAPTDYQPSESIALRAHRLEFAHPSKQNKLIFEVK